MSETQFTRIFDFSGGIRDSEENPLSFPENALLDGMNVMIVSKALVTRPGVVVLGELYPGD